MRLTTGLFSLLFTIRIAGAQMHTHEAATPSAAALQQIREVQQAMASLSTPDAAHAAGFEPSLECIQEIQPMFKGDYTLVLKSGARLRSSRTHRADVQALIRGT